MEKSTVAGWLAIGVLGVSSAASAATYNAGADFQTLSNPGGPWSYGYSPGTGSYSMRIFDSPFDTSLANTTISAWSMSDYVSLGAPVIWKNTSANFFYLNVPPGQLAMHPGPIPRGDLAVLRFTAPSAGQYDYVGRFGAGGFGDTSARLVFNGDLFHPEVSFDTTASSPSFEGFVKMKMGQTLDFVVGNKGDYSGDTTSLWVSISSPAMAAPVPEPETYAMMLAGLGLLGFAARRRLTSN